MLQDLISGNDPVKLFKMTKQDKLYLKEWLCTPTQLLTSNSSPRISKRAEKNASGAEKLQAGLVVQKGVSP